MDRIGLLVELIGNQQAMSSLRDFKKLADELNSKKIELRVSTQGIDRELARVNREIADLRNDRKNVVRMQGDTSDIDKKLSELTYKKNELTQKKAEMRIDASVNTEALVLANDQLRQMQQNAREAADAVQAIGGVLSGAVGGLGNMASGLGDMFSSMASMFNTDLLRTVTRTLAFTATRYVTSNISGITSRYDVMNTFTQYMELAGVAADKANESLSKVDQSIRGIPIGLDEAATRLRRYQMFLGDIERATNLTIGVQRALMAGGANEQMRTTAYTQIDRLLATGKLGQSRQWISLFNGLGVSLKFVKEELAIDPATRLQDIASELASGKIPVDEFLHALERLADNEGLGRAIDIYKSTIESWTSNIVNAVKRGGTSVLNALNDTMTQTFGKGITGVMEDIRDQIDRTSASMAQFVRDNPQNLQVMRDIVVDIAERLRSVDWEVVVGKFVDRLGQLFDMVFRLVDAIPDGFLSDFVTFAITIAGPLGAIFKVVSSGAPIMFGIFNALKDMDFAALIEKIVRQVELLAGVIERVISVLPEGLLGDLMAFGLVWGRPLAGVISQISNAISGIIIGLSGMRAGSSYGVLGQIANFVVLHPVITAAGVALGVLAAGLTSYLKAAQERYENAFPTMNKHIENLKEGVESSKAVLDAQKGLLTDIDRDIVRIDQKAEATKSAIDNIKTANEALKTITDDGKRSELIDTLTEETNKLRELTDIDFTVSTAGLSAEDEAVLGLAESYAELLHAKELNDSYVSGRSQIEDSLNELRVEKEILETRQQIIKDNMDYIRQQMGGIDPLQLVQDVFTDEDSRSFFNAVNQLGVGGVGNLSAPLTKDQAEKIGPWLQKWGQLAEQYKENEKTLQGINDQISENEQVYERLGMNAQRVAGVIQSLIGKDFSAFVNGQEVMYESLDENLQMAIASYRELRDEAEKTIREQMSGFDEFTAAEDKFASDLQTNIQARRDALETYKDDLKGIADFSMQLGSTTINAEAFRDIAAEIAAGGYDMASWANALNDAITQYLSGNVSPLETLLSTWDAKGLAEQQAADYMAALQQALLDGGEIFTLIAENPEWFGTAAETMIDTLTSQIQTAVENADVGALETLKTQLETALAEVDSEALAENAGVIESAITQINDAITKLSPDSALGESLQGIVDTLTTAVGGEGGILETFTNLNSELDVLNEKDMSPFIAILGDVIAVIAQLAEEFAHVETNAGKASTNISLMAQTAQNKVPLIQSLRMELGNLAAQFSVAAGMANSLATAINNIPTSKTVTVNVQRNNTVTALPESSGGLIPQYYSKGAWVDFRRNGTDIIPAMLTPGEYVVRKSAVQMWGKPFFDAINRLDAGRAYNAMMSRVSNLFGTTITNHDSHAQVIQNFYGSTGQGFSQKVALRAISRL